MARIGPGTGLNGPNAGDENRNASGLDNDDTGSDGSSADDENNSSGGSNITGAASGHMRAGLHGEAGSQEIASDKHASAGTSVDTIVTGDDQPDVVATDSRSLDKTVTAVASEDVTGGDGGTGASIKTETGEIDSGRPGSTSRIQEAVMSAQSTDGGGDGGDGSTTTTTTTDSGGDGGAAEQNPLLPSVPGAGGSGASIGGGGPLNFGDSGSLMDKLTSPAGLLVAIIATAVVVFGGSEALDEDGE